MAKAERRRAPKRSKHAEEEGEQPPFEEEMQQDPEWVHMNDANTPFGLVAPEMQAYFKEVNGTLTNLLHSEDPDAGAEEAEMLLQAALTEMDGHELVLATDPTCSLVLENMAGIMKEKALRVFFDRMSGSYRVLASHRYGSHVLQSMLAAAQRMLNTSDPADNAVDADHGVLRSLPQLIEAMFFELEPELESMLTEAFASHVLRSIVALLAGVPIASFDDMRSKRSSKYRSKERQRAMVDTTSDLTETGPLCVPYAFLRLVYQLYEDLHGALSTTQLYTLIPNAVAAPSISVLLKLESGLRDGKRSMAERSDSLTSRVLGDLSEGTKERSDVMESALRDAVATHVLQSALQGASATTLDHFWEVYVRGRLAKLGGHPCANFVVSTLLRLLPVNGAPFAEALAELDQAGDHLVKNQVLGVLQAAIERCAQAHKKEQEVLDAVLSAFRFPADGDATLFVPVLLSMRTFKAYSHTVGDDAKGAKRKREESEPYTTQGSILLQRLAQLHAPHQDRLYKSLSENAALAEWCCSSTAVHVILAALAAPTATYAQRRTLLKSLMPLLVDLCDDAWGSRVADAVWNAADGFTKEKIAQLMLSHEKRLLASPYGRFFVRRLRLGIYRKSLGEWKEWAKAQTAPAPPAPPAEPVNPFGFLRTRKLDKHAKRGSAHADQQLADILSAIP